MKTLQEKKIELLEELVKALNDQVTLVCSDSFKDMEGYGYKALASSQKITQFESELATLDKETEQGEEKHETCDGCIMLSDCGCMIDDSCRPCVDRDQWTSQEQMDKRIDDAFIEISHHCELAVDDIKAAITNYIDGKNVEPTKDTDKRKRAEEISYVICRNFVGEWLWNAPKYGDIRSSESFSLDQSRDAASMILRFIKQYASQSGYPEEFEKFCIWFKKNTQSTDLGYYHVIEEHGRFAFFELYNYWLINIKDK